MKSLGAPLKQITQNLESVSILGQWTEGRNNNLDALRLIGAILVILAHSFAIHGLPDLMPPFYKRHYGILGVGIFFIISGFLITQSYLRSNNPVRFVWARFLRIFPALIVVTLFLTFILGPILTTLPLEEYLTHPWTRTYLAGTLSLYGVTQYTVLPGVFMSNPIVQTNGPLWTLQYEWSFYIIILLLGITTLLTRKGVMIALFVFSLVLTYIGVGNYSSTFWTLVHFIPVFFMYFVFGSITYLYRNQIPMSLGGFLFVILMLGIGSLKKGFDDYLFVFFLGYLVLFIGFSPKVRISWLTKYGDFSYGLYIWGWPVEQTVFHFLGKDTNVWVQFFISLAVALLFSIFSWKFVEKKMLRLKNMQFNFLFTKKSRVIHIDNGA